MKYISSIINIGNVALGGNNPVRVQSMTTTNTLDTDATVKQVISLALAGCDFVRITSQNIKEAKNLKNIVNELKRKGIDIPLIADVHYNPKVAEVAAQFVNKVRINPGNYINNNKVYSVYSRESDNDELTQMEKNLIPLLDICSKFGTAIRIGVNHGSLSKRMLYKHGNTALGMVESIMEFITICQKNNFKNLVLSLKASNVVAMINANILLVERLKELGLSYPIHLGVTEAGSDDEGRIKSAAGIGYLLSRGIGDTIRVSLAEDPLAEVPVALKLVKLFGHRKEQIVKKHCIIPISKSAFNVKSPVVVTKGISTLSDLAMDKYEESKQLPNDKTFLIGKLSYDGLSYDDLVINSTVESTILLLENKVDGLWIENTGISSSDTIAELSLGILQVLGLRITTTEYIACPTCGRTSINVIEQLRKVKLQTSHFPGLKIAVMGCAVNGPGEMADAHYGFVGSGKGMVNIYKGSDIVMRNVQPEKAVELLVDLIKENEG
ncbi:MAG: (E)-4-hydroxy-3-methylbut-2-enyl-diphosphate synthase [Bacteroidota bacterium]